MSGIRVPLASRSVHGSNDADMRCRASIVGGIGTLALAILATGAAAQPAGAEGGAGASAGASPEVVQILPNFYLIAGAGSNIAVQTGPDGTVLVDGGSAQAAQQVLGLLARITSEPIRYIIDTSADADVVGGTGVLADSGRSVFAGAPVAAGSGNAGGGQPATILAPISVLLRVSAPTGVPAPYPNDVWPTQAFDSNRSYLYLNHEAIEVYRQTAHDNTDSIVLFRGSDVIVAGDIIDSNHFPVIDVEHGGSIQGEIAALNHILELSDRPIPFVYQAGGTYIVAGHGRLYQQADVVQYRDMLVIIRSIIQRMVARGMSLSQIIAASPCLAFQRQYGSDSGPWTTKDFIRAVYESLTRRPPRARDPI